MARNASTEARMGSLHAKLTEIFIKILEKYDGQLSMETAEDELMDAIGEPNPAMLGAVAKFLKDNSISIETEELNELTAMEQRLKNKRKNRPNLASVTTLPLVADV